MGSHLYAGIVGVCLGVLVIGCSSANRIAMEPSSLMGKDVFTAQGLTEEGRWVGVTNQFDPERDSRVVVVANLSKEDRSRTLVYELVNPANNVVWSEERMYPRQDVLGIYVEMPKLLEMGGEGNWTANVYADGNVLGQSKFVIGDPEEDLDEITGPRYFVVGAEPEDEVDEMEAFQNRFDDYIQEVTPELDITWPEDLPDLTPVSPNINPQIAPAE